MVMATITTSTLNPRSFRRFRDVPMRTSFIPAITVARSRIRGTDRAHGLVRQFARRLLPCLLTGATRTRMVPTVRHIIMANRGPLGASPQFSK